MKEVYLTPRVCQQARHFAAIELIRREEELQRQREALEEIARLARRAKASAAIFVEHHSVVIAIVSEFYDKLLSRTSEEIRALRKKKKQLRRLYFKLFHRCGFSYLATPLLLLFYEYVDIRTTHKEAKEMHNPISFIKADSSHKSSLSYEINRKYISNAHAA